jgi:hypothetical protein
VRATCTGGCVPDTVFALRADDEAVTARFDDDSTLLVEPGVADDADVVIETDPSTLFCIASRQVSTADAIKSKDLRVTGSRKDAERFLALFSFDEPRSHAVEHV